MTHEEILSGAEKLFDELKSNYAPHEAATLLAATTALVIKASYPDPGITSEERVASFVASLVAHMQILVEGTVQ